ncbi:MAG: oligopeptide transporter, OPT family [Calditrichaeota bacterium]|nr:oligopeptide transporter, OPT family [Calditrichota bacterium]MCB9368104.1 oligopeptide transporter, OPT family [Calditrichota bacterium]
MDHPHEHTKKVFRPYVSAETTMAESTLRALILGAVLGMVFTAANAYLGLYVGMTVSASIPAAVMSMFILRKIFKGGTILENNIVQTVASSGESLAAGIIFTIPAFYIWSAAGRDVEIPSLSTIAYISLIGGALGILMMIPLRRMLIRDEHETLPYPEGTACAEVLLAGERGGAHAQKVFWGLFAGAGYKLLTGAAIIRENLTYVFRTPSRAYLGIDAIPALVGVGYIIGLRVSAIMLAGGLLSSMVLVPVIAFFGESAIKPIFPVTDALISAMDSETIRSQYVRYIGAGAVTMGGILSLLKALPSLFRSLTKMRGRSAAAATSERTDDDLPPRFVLAGTAIVSLLSWLLAPHVPAVIPLIAVFGFIFVMVASRIVGLVGSSSNPVSGMTIATLLGTTLLFSAFGIGGIEGMAAALMVGAVVCVAICMAGDISQDLKTGFILGATPRKQQISEFVGVIAGVVVVGWVVHLLGSTYGFVQDAAHPNALQAPQANLMAILIEGVMDGKLQWSLIFFGMFIAAIVELFGVTSLAFAVGLYLPVGLSVGIMSGALIKHFASQRNELSEAEDGGVLFSSGLIAGEALVGIALALFATVGFSLEAFGGILGTMELPITIIAYGILLFALWRSVK